MSASDGPLEKEQAEEVIDTSRMSEGQRQALELTEEARELTPDLLAFAPGLFLGRLDLEQLHPFPEQPPEDVRQGDAFLDRMSAFLDAEVDPDEIDRSGEIPQHVIDGLAKLGAFGIKIPEEYGGLGLSQTNYSRTAMLLGSCCGNTTALLSAHQSIGVPQPLLLFGTDEQKRRYLPRVAHGEISAFALTEINAGSDPARIETRAEPTPDGRHFILNGEKLWCTNGTRAGIIVVMAQTPPREIHGRLKNQITAFIVEANAPGVQVTHRCRFMGLRALYNAVIRFENVKVPRENILLAEGKGLRVALTTLNTGRLTLPAACVGLSKRCLAIARRWADERVQWGCRIGDHEAVAVKLARMAADTFAMESMVLYASSLVDRDKHADVRLEAALAKLWATEHSWRIVNDTMQIRGGRGYETAQSLAARGEEPVPVERFLRDSRINTIFEGSSEIMRLFLAREAVDPHLKIAGPILNPRLSLTKKAGAAGHAAVYYARWYPGLWFPSRVAGLRQFPPVLRGHLRFASRSSRRLARRLFHQMVKFGPKLERRQLLLGRFVDIGADLFAITTSCARAQQMGNGNNAMALVNYLSITARERIEQNFRSIGHNGDRSGYRLAQSLLDE